MTSVWESSECYEIWLGSLNNNLIRLALGFEFLIKIKMECSKSRNIIGDGDGDDENEEDILLGPIL